MGSVHVPERLRDEVQMRHVWPVLVVVVATLACVPALEPDGAHEGEGEEGSEGEGDASEGEGDGEGEALPDAGCGCTTCFEIETQTELNGLSGLTEVHRLTIGACNVEDPITSLAPLSSLVRVEETFALTGHPVGGVCPFGLATDLPVYLDLSLKAFDVVYPAGGSLNTSVRVETERLFELVFPGETDVQYEAVEVVVYRLRKKLAGTGATLMTLRGLGYLLREEG